MGGGANNPAFFEILKMVLLMDPHVQGKHG